VKVKRLLIVITIVLLTIGLSAGAAWFYFTHPQKVKLMLGLEKPPVELSKKPLFKPLEKFVISLESDTTSNYLMLELALVTHDPSQMEIYDNLKPVIRNAMVQFFSHRDLNQVRQDLQNVDALQTDLKKKLSETISNYGYKPAIDEVLVTKVVLQ
jgi:Flagellar basal body-associated protein